MSISSPLQISASRREQHITAKHNEKFARTAAKRSRTATPFSTHWCRPPTMLSDSYDQPHETAFSTIEVKPEKLRPWSINAMLFGFTSY
jgi:hypothetical protein